MEKKYIWFDTGVGCFTSVLALAVAAAMLVVIYPFIAASPLLFAVVLFSLLLGTLWLPFYIERRRKSRSRAQDVPTNSDH